MALAGCPSCGGAVDISAQSCVHCGREFLGLYRDSVLCLACCWPGKKKEQCARCSGTGRNMIEGHFLMECRFCKGEGKYLHRKPVGWRVWRKPETEIKPCPGCKGSGKVIQQVA